MLEKENVREKWRRKDKRTKRNSSYDEEEWGVMENEKDRRDVGIGEKINYKRGLGL